MTNSYDFLFVFGFALIPFLKKSETTQENTYLQVLHSYLERKFKFDNSLPMPYLLDYYFYELMTYLNYKDSLKLIILQGIRIVYHILLVWRIGSFRPDFGLKAKPKKNTPYFNKSKRKKKQKKNYF